MKKLHLLTLGVLVALSTVQGQTTVSTDPVGFVSVSVPTQSDVALGAPLHRPSEFQGVVQSISGNVLVVAGAPGWSANQFVYVQNVQPKTYYVRIDSGAKEGMVAQITQNDSTSVTVTAPAGEDLTGILTNAADGTGDFISIAPYWTLSSLVAGAVAGTQVLVLPSNVAGINLSPTTYTFNGTNWLRGATVSNDDVIAPYQGVTVRNNSTTTVLSLTMTGSVPMSAHRLRLATLAANTRQDTRIFYNSPIPEVIGSVFNSSALMAGDQFLYTDNSASGKNKPSTTLVWNGTNWLQGATVVTGTFTLQPGQSYVFRKNQTGATPSGLVWSDIPPYLQ